MGSAVTLPTLEQIPTAARHARREPYRRPHGRLVVVHRWGVARWQAEDIGGVINLFLNPDNEASSHLVYAGEDVGPDSGRCVQMVQLADAAWTERAWNDDCISIETGDAMWLGHDPEGLHRAARIVGWLLKSNGFQPVWVHGDTMLGNPGTTGFTRHADLGAKGGGHTSCPTTDHNLWQAFISLVQFEYNRGQYRPVWAT